LICVEHAHAYPPFDTPRTVTVRLVPFTQNRLIWRVGVNGGTGRASEVSIQPLAF
jgi:hypothetical protein